MEKGSIIKLILKPDIAFIQINLSFPKEVILKEINEFFKTIIKIQTFQTRFESTMLDIILMDQMYGREPAVRIDEKIIAFNYLNWEIIVLGSNYEIARIMLTTDFYPDSVRVEINRKEFSSSDECREYLHRHNLSTTNEVWIFLHFKKFIPDQRFWKCWLFDKFEFI